MIIAIVGAIGSGKTLMLTYFLHQLQSEGFKVLSNYRLKFPHTLIDRDMILNYSDDNTQLKDCALGIDEAHIILDCRNSAKATNKMLSYFILQTRKRQVLLLWTSQNFTQCERRLREQTDFILTCRPVYQNKALRCIDVTMTRYLGHDRYQDMRTFRLRHPEAIYPLYDTYEIVDFEGGTKKKERKEKDSAVEDNPVSFDL